jgi:hypothetical protein
MGPRELPDAREQAAGSSAVFAGAPAATAVPSLDFLMGLLLRDGPAGSILESSLCLRRSSSNGLIRPDGVPRPTHGWDEARIWPRCRPLGSLFCFIRHAKRGLMRRWRKRPPDEGRGAARAQPTPMGNTSSQPRSLIDARKQKQYRGAGKPPESRRRDTKKASNHQSLRRTRAPIATPAPPPAPRPPPPRRPGPSSSAHCPTTRTARRSWR